MDPTDHQLNALTAEAIRFLRAETTRPLSTAAMIHTLTTAARLAREGEHERAGQVLIVWHEQATRDEVASA